MVIFFPSLSLFKEQNMSVIISSKWLNSTMTMTKSRRQTTCRSCAVTAHTQTQYTNTARTSGFTVKLCPKWKRAKLQQLDATLNGSHSSRSVISPTCCHMHPAGPARVTFFYYTPACSCCLGDTEATVTDQCSLSRAQHGMCSNQELEITIKLKNAASLSQPGVKQSRPGYKGNSKSQQTNQKSRFWSFCFHKQYYLHLISKQWILCYRDSIGSALCIITTYTVYLWILKIPKKCWYVRTESNIKNKNWSTALSSLKAQLYLKIQSSTGAKPA